MAVLNCSNTEMTANTGQLTTSKSSRVDSAFRSLVTAEITRFTLFQPTENFAKQLALLATAALYQIRPHRSRGETTWIGPEFDRREPLEEKSDRRTSSHIGWTLIRWELLRLSLQSWNWIPAWTRWLQFGLEDGRWCRNSLQLAGHCWPPVVLNRQFSPSRRTMLRSSGWAKGSPPP